MSQSSLKLIIVFIDFLCLAQNVLERSASLCSVYHHLRCITTFSASISSINLRESHFSRILKNHPSKQKMAYLCSKQALHFIPLCFLVIFDLWPVCHTILCLLRNLERCGKSSFISVFNLKISYK